MPEFNYRIEIPLSFGSEWIINRKDNFYNFYIINKDNKCIGMSLDYHTLKGIVDEIAFIRKNKPSEQKLFKWQMGEHLYSVTFEKVQKQPLFIMAYGADETFDSLILSLSDMDKIVKVFAEAKFDSWIL